MLRPCGHKLYLSMKDLKPVGVFSSPEKAQVSAPDSLTEIEPFFLEGTPLSERYVCMAKGSSVMLTLNGDSFSSRHFDLGPVWGVNPQSAIAALCTVPEKRKNVLTETFCLFEIDRAYPEGGPASVCRERPFRPLTDRIYDWDELPEETIGADYLTLYFEQQRRDAEQLRQYREAQRRKDSPEMRFVCAAMIRMLLDDHPDLIAPYASRDALQSEVYPAFSQSLAHLFTQEEFDRLTGALRTQSARTSSLPDDSAPDENTLLIDKAYDACRLELALLKNPGSRFLRICRRLI